MTNMTRHNIVILRCHTKKDPTKQFYVSLSSEEPDLGYDEFWNMVAHFIQHQDSDPQQTSIYGIVEEVVQHGCALSLSDRMNGIHFKPIYASDGEWFGGEPIEPFMSEDLIPTGNLYARHVLIPVSYYLSY
jgi:hypothetical protein